MAVDWIKMRTDLYRDPKVCLIADLMMRTDGELGRYVNQNCQSTMSVTRNVMRNAVVGALLTIWGVMRHRGKRTGDDLSVKNCGLSVLDDISDMPGFGSAMMSVRWVVEAENSLVFPRFFEEYNADPVENQRAKAAERARRFREKHRNVTRNVTRNAKVTLEKRRVEKSREKKKNPPSPFVPELIAKVHDGDQFAAAWSDFCQHRREIKKPLTPRAAIGAMAMLEAIPVDRATAALRHTVAMGWQGIREPEVTRSTRTTTESRADRNRRIAEEWAAREDAKCQHEKS